MDGVAPLLLLRVEAIITHTAWRDSSPRAGLGNAMAWTGLAPARESGAAGRRGASELPSISCRRGSMRGRQWREFAIAGDWRGKLIGARVWHQVVWYCGARRREMAVPPPHLNRPQSPPICRPVLGVARQQQRQRQRQADVHLRAAGTAHGMPQRSAARCSVRGGTAGGHFLNWAVGGGEGISCQRPQSRAGCRCGPPLADGATWEDEAADLFML